MPKPRITDAHYCAFGKIITRFTGLEVLLDLALATALKVDPSLTAYFTATLRYEQKRDLLLTINSVGSWSAAQGERLDNFLKEIDSASKLRRHVAHSVWKPGRKAGNIKPMSPKAKGKLRLIGMQHNEKEYSVDDLEAEAARMEDIARRFKKFLHDCGLRAPS